MTRLNKLILFFCLVSTTVLAQVEPTDTPSVVEKLVERPYENQIKDPNKLNIPIHKFPIAIKDITFDYAITPSLYRVNTYFREPMQPISLGTVQMPPLSPFYAQAGFGTNRNAILDLYYSSKRHKSWTYSARGYHRSGMGPIDASGFGNSLVELNGKKNFNRHILTGDFNFRQTRSHLYGHNYDSLVFEEPDTIRRDFFYYGGNIGFGNQRSTQTTHHYNTNLSGYYFNDNKGKHEWDLRFQASITEHLKSGDNLFFKADYDYSSYGDTAQKINRNLVKIEAAYLHEKGKLKVKGGIKAATDNGDSVITENPNTQDYTRFHLYPDIHAEYKLVKNYLIGFAGITGGLTKNDYRSSVMINPFVNEQQYLLNTNNLLRAYGGVKGSISDNWLFNVKLDYKNYDRFLLFANDSVGNSFQSVYSGKNSSMFTVHGEVQYKQYERWMINFSGDYNYYNFYTYEPLHLPTLEGHLSARYNFQDKIVGKLQIDAFDNRLAGNVSRTDTVELKGAVDVSLGADYYVNPRLAIYGSINNLLNRRYELWNRYPVQGLHAWIGIRFAL